MQRQAGGAGAINPAGPATGANMSALHGLSGIKVGGAAAGAACMFSTCHPQDPFLHMPDSATGSSGRMSWLPSPGSSSHATNTCVQCLLPCTGEGGGRAGRQAQAARQGDERLREVGDCAAHQVG